jgi:hypothetical protein
MEWSPRASAIAATLWARHPDLAHASDLSVDGDDGRRALMRIIAEQLAFEFGTSYGVKSASPTRPQGPSQIAWRVTADTLGGWRIVGADGQDGPTVISLVARPIWQVWPGQTFIPVEPVDHLGVRAVPDLPPITVSMPPERPPAVPSEAVDPSAILAALARVDASLTALEGRLADLDAREPPTYRGSLFGITVVLHPDPPRR